MKWTPKPRAAKTPAVRENPLKKPGHWEMKNGEFVRVMERASA